MGAGFNAGHSKTAHRNHCFHARPQFDPITCALSLIRVPQELTEFFIALSIFVLAVEAARHRLNPEAHSAAKGLVTRHSFWVCVLFGLLHGLGFAGALRRNRASSGRGAHRAIDVQYRGRDRSDPVYWCRPGDWRYDENVAKQQFPVISPDRWVWMPIYLIGSGSTYWCIDRSLGLIG